MKNNLTLGILLLLTLLLVGCSGGTGSVAFETEPTGAEIYLGNQLLGTTPLYVPEVQEGNVKATIRKPGYETKQVNITVKPEQETIVSEELSMTQEELFATAKSQSHPAAPVQLFLLNAASLIDVPYEEYWHEIVQLGFGKLFVNTIEDRFKLEGGTSELVNVLGKRSALRVHQFGVDLAIVSVKDTDVTFVVGLDESKWYLINLGTDYTDYKSYASMTYEELASDTIEWITNVTGLSTIVDLFGDEDDKENLLSSTELSEVETKPRWRTIKRWKGQGSKQTETFEIENNEWQIEWSANDEYLFGVLFVYLYGENGNLVSAPVNQTGEGRGSTYVRGAGRYYLQIEGANIDWEIKVSDYT